MLMRCDPSAEELEAYFGLEPEQIAQIVLLLLMQTNIQQKLNAVLVTRISRSTPPLDAPGVRRVSESIFYLRFQWLPAVTESSHFIACAHIAFM
jgi:hypothetical protein